MSDANAATTKGSRTGLWIKRALVLGVGVAIVGGTVVGLAGMNAAAPRPEEKEE